MCELRPSWIDRWMTSSAPWMAPVTGWTRAMRCTFSPNPPVSLPVFLIGLIWSVTVFASFTRASADFVFSGVIRFSRPR